MAKKCPMCGASLKNNDIECQYCGTDVSTDTKSTTSANYTYSETSTTFDNTNQGQPNQTTYTRSYNRNKPFNIGLFIFLMIFFSPLAIIYVILYCMGGSNNHRK